MSDPSPDSMDRPPPPWGHHDLEVDGERSVRLGPLELRMKRTDQEIWLTQRRVEGEPGASGPEKTDAAGTNRTKTIGEPTDERRAPEAGAGLAEGDEPEWSRWAVPEDTTGVRLEPVFPDRALVVEPEQTFHLVRGARVRVYVRVPLWVSVGLPSPSGVGLTEIPTHILSDTWFGDFTEGELAYALPTSARRRVTPDVFAPHLAICPLSLGNDGVDQLEVEKLCLRVAHLSLFSRGPALWSDETRVRYQGEDEQSRIHISGDVPREAPDAVRVRPPRIPLARGFRARTFARLADLSGFGASS